MKRIISVQEVMETNVLKTDIDTTAAKAAKSMAMRDVGSIIIVQGGKPYGILTERDLLIKVVAEDLRPSAVRVGKIMSKPLITVPPEMDLVDAARLMAKNKIRRLPVLKKGKLVGVLSASDITATLPELSEMVDVPNEPLKENIGESVCENCGEFTTELHEANGKFVCENCREAMSE